MHIPEFTPDFLLLKSVSLLVPLNLICKLAIFLYYRAIASGSGLG